EREVLSSSPDSLLPGKNEIQEGLNEIIRMAWSHDEDERINIDEMYLKLSKLSKRDSKPDLTKYLKMAADNGNVAAQYNLACLYLKSKTSSNQDKEIGLGYLNLAIQNNNEKALELKK
ncbi:2562_t:CDS:2, partial [Dentiscutata erythropus]